MKFFRTMEAFSENAWVNLVAAIVLTASAIDEIVGSTEGGGFHIGHGLLAFGLLQVLRFLPHLVEAAEGINKVSRGQSAEEE